MKTFPFCIAFIMFFSCTKHETEIITIKKPNASFQVSVTKNVSNVWGGCATYIDSFFYFKNTSDTASDISYLWDFGDGTASNEKDPKHQYSKRGIYNVKLAVTKSNQFYDTSSQTIKVILGQKMISLGNDKSAYANDVFETADKGFLIAGSYYTSSSYDDIHWFFLKTDSLLNQTDLIVFPVSIQFSSVKRTNDGNFILCGTTTGNNRYNELIKMDDDGNIIWNKTFATDLYIRDAEQFADNSFAFVANKPSSLQGYYDVTVIGKTDESGNELWTKTLDKNIIMSTASNLVIDNNDIVVAGLKKYESGIQNSYCEYCDSLIIAKYSSMGQPKWYNTVLWGLNRNSYYDTRIARHQGGVFSVVNKQGDGLYLFDNNGTFTDRKILQTGYSYNLNYHTSSSDNNILMVGTEWANGFSMKISKHSITGTELWLTGVNGTLEFDGTWICCMDSEGATAIPLSIGGNMVIGSRLDYISKDYYEKHRKLLLLQLDEDGSIK